MTSSLELRGVWKAYPRWPSGGRTLRGIVARRAPLLVRGGERRWAVRDVSLDLGAGEAMAVIGPNGAGKSTLLRVASGLSRPTRGDLRLAASSASVLSFDSWFDLDLTGRENALTALVVHGWRLDEARRLLGAVLEFGELEEFADAPVRTYSEGMKLRLAFGVVAQLEPRVLIVDEVLAVGDLRFQEKCLERIRELRRRGSSLLLASHALEQVADECERAIWLQGGAVRAAGAADEVARRYREAMAEATLDRTPPQLAEPAGGLELRRNRFGTQEITIDRVRLRSESGETAELASGEGLVVGLSVTNRAGVAEAPVIGVAIHRSSDGVVCYDTSTESDGVRVGPIDGRLEANLRFDRLDLLPGDYALDVGVYHSGWDYAYDFHWQAYPLRVIGHRPDKGVFRPPHRWEIAG